MSLGALAARIASDAPDLTLFRRLLALREDADGVRDDLRAALESAPVETSRHLAGVRSYPSVADAIAQAGYRRVHSAAIAAIVVGWWGGECRVLDYLQYWRHAVATAVLTTVAARAARRHDDAAFAAGLMHDTGRLALDHHAAAALTRSIAMARSLGTNASAAQNALLGFNEADVGGRVGIELDLPPWLTAAMCRTESVSPAEPFSVTGLVASACAAANLLGLPDGAGLREEIAPLTRAYAGSVIAALEHAGGRPWLETRIERTLAAALFTERTVGVP